MRTDAIDYLAEKFGKTHHELAASASEMLTITLRAFGCEGGEVIVPNGGCHSVAAAVVRAGASPVFVDIGQDLVLTSGDITAATSPSTRAAVVVDQYGLPANHKAIRDALPGGVPLIADLAQSWDASLSGVQSGIAADAVIMSFGPGKPISVGAGGAVFANVPIHGVEHGNLSDRYATNVSSAGRFPAPLLELLNPAIDDADRAVRIRRQAVDELRNKIELLPLVILPLPPDVEPSWTRVPLLQTDAEYDTSFLKRFGSLQYPHDVPVAHLPMFTTHRRRVVRRPDSPKSRPLLLKITDKGHDDSD